MFGYVRVYKPELKMKDFDIYNGIYCTLCDYLSSEYGLWARLTLTYDFTFFALFRLALQTEEMNARKGHCKLNPTKKCLKFENDIFSFTAACGVLMFYYKVQDDLHDRGFSKKVRSFFLLPFAYFARRKAIKKYQELDTLISEQMAVQATIETENTKSLDRAAHPSAFALGKLLAYNVENSNKEEIERFGYFLGRWVYLMDALDDIPKDLKHRSYNPLIPMFELEKGNTDNLRKAQNFMNGTLNLTANELYDSFESIHFDRFKPILENILTDGMYHAQKSVFNSMKEVKADEQASI